MSVEPWIEACPRRARIRPADVPEQQLDDRRRADVLHPDGVLCPADRVDKGGGALAARVLAQRLRHGEELLLGTATDFGHGLRRIAAVVLFQELKDAAR